MADFLPRWKHDCTRCEFLGGVTLNQRYDLYLCPCERGTIVARYGDEGPEYTSCALDIWEDRLRAALLPGSARLCPSDLAMLLGLLRSAKAHLLSRPLKEEGRG